MTENLKEQIKDAASLWSLNGAEWPSEFADEVMSLLPSWQPIETAPKMDFEDVLLFAPQGGVRVASWYNGQWSMDYPELDNPTHWLPIPPTP